MANELIEKIDQICVGYYFFRNSDGVERAKDLSGEIQTYLGQLLRLTEGDTSEEGDILRHYIAEVVEDYMSAIDQRDLVLMIDTLEYGLRELLQLSTGEAEESQ
jgi:hypothetical protein